MELQFFVELFFPPQENCSRSEDWARDLVLVALFLSPFPLDILLSFSQAFGSPVVLTGSHVELFVHPIGLFLGLVVLPFLSMWEI